MSELELKPCPFCGGVPTLEEKDGTNYYRYRVFCEKCAASQAWEHIDRIAISRWNNRVENIVRCSDCCKYHSFGNGYGECSFFGRTMKDSEYCSSGLKK